MKLWIYIFPPFLFLSLSKTDSSGEAVLHSRPRSRLPGEFYIYILILLLCLCVVCFFLYLCDLGVMELGVISMK